MGPDGSLWFQFSGRLSIGRLTTAGAYTEFPITTGLAVHDIAAGVDGNLWFTNSDYAFETYVGRITPSGQVTTWPLPLPSSPRGIAAGPDGAIWFANGYDVGRINPGAPAPSVTRVTPSFGPDAGGTPITILGTGFQAGATVSVGGVPATGVTVVDTTTITATTGPHVTGAVDLTVTNPDSSSGTLPNAYFYIPPEARTRFYTLPPCRVVDTRGGAPIGGPILAPSEQRVLPLAGSCGIPPYAGALSVNVTVVPAAAGYLTLFPGNGVNPGSSNINFGVGQVRANNAILRLATDGTGTAVALNGSVGSNHLIVDVNGYFR